jgi:hypothetical protein
MAASWTRVTRLKSPIGDLLHHGSKAASTTQVDPVPVECDLLCNICRTVKFESLRLVPGDDVDVLCWDLSTTRRSPRCPLCRFLLTILFVPEELDFRQIHTICVWPQPIATYSYWGPMGAWDILSSPFLYAAKSLGLPYRILQGNWSLPTQQPGLPNRILGGNSNLPTQRPSTVAYQLCIGLKPSLSATEPRRLNAADQSNEIEICPLELHNQDQVASKIPSIGYFNPNFPDEPRITTGYRVRGLNSDSKELSYPTSQRSTVPIAAYLSDFSDFCPVDVHLSRRCIQLQARNPKGPMDR